MKEAFETINFVLEDDLAQLTLSCHDRQSLIEELSATLDAP